MARSCVPFERNDQSPPASRDAPHCELRPRSCTTATASLLGSLCEQVWFWLTADHPASRLSLLIHRPRGPSNNGERAVLLISQYPLRRCSTSLPWYRVATSSDERLSPSRNDSQVSLYSVAFPHPRLPAAVTALAWLPHSRHRGELSDLCATAVFHAPPSSSTATVVQYRPRVQASDTLTDCTHK